MFRIALIERCKIYHNEGSGVKISGLSTAKIKACEIKKNEKGVEVENADPFIFLNIIKENEQEGIILRGELVMAFLITKLEGHFARD